VEKTRAARATATDHRLTTDTAPTLGRIFRFWLPLEATWLMMAIEGPLLAAVIARLAEPKYNLAAYGVAYALALVIEAPVIMMMSASTALVRNRDTYRALRDFTNVLNVGLTILMAVLVIPSVFEFVAQGLIGLPEEVSRRAHIATLILLPWPGAIGFRRFYQGVLIRSGRTRDVARGTVVRLATMLMTVFAGATLTSLEGAWVGAASLTAGVVLEAVASRFMARHAVSALLTEADGEQPAAEQLTLRTILAFYYPLALTSLLSLGVHPLVTFFVGRSRMPIESLAVLPVVNALVFLFRSLGLAYQEVGIALMGDQMEGFGALRRFATLLAIAAACGLCLIAWSPLATVWFQHISGLSPELTRFAITPVRILALMPALTVVLSFQRSLLVVLKATRPVTWATVTEVVGVVATLWLATVFFGVVGAVAAALGFMVGRLGSNLYLVIVLRRLLLGSTPVEGSC